MLESEIADALLTFRHSLILSRIVQGKEVLSRYFALLQSWIFAVLTGQLNYV